MHTLLPGGKSPWYSKGHAEVKVSNSHGLKGFKEISTCYSISSVHITIFVTRKCKVMEEEIKSNKLSNN